MLNSPGDFDRGKMSRKVAVAAVIVNAVVIILAGLSLVDMGSPPGAPSGLRTNGGIDSVSISWAVPSDAGSGITGHHVYRWPQN